MKKLQLRGFTKRFVTLGVMGIMAMGALLPVAAFAAPTQSTKCAAADVKCVIAVGDQLISNRLGSLNTLSTKIASDLSTGKITSDQAGTLQADVSTNETGLNNLKTKLDGETVAKNARVDVENIYLQFRIYAVVLPRDYRHLLLDIEINVREKLVDVAPAIQAAIAKAPASQQNKLNALFSDYQKQVANAETQFDIANQDIPQMTPENFNQNHASYEVVRISLDNATRTASKDLHQAARDLHQIVIILGHDI
jgi:hypothetical protein